MATSISFPRAAMVTSLVSQFHTGTETKRVNLVTRGRFIAGDPKMIESEAVKLALVVYEMDATVTQITLVA
jgi:hypothetical protein